MARGEGGVGRRAFKQSLTQGGDDEPAQCGPIDTRSDDVLLIDFQLNAQIGLRPQVSAQVGRQSVAPAGVGVVATHDELGRHAGEHRFPMGAQGPLAGSAGIVEQADVGVTHLSIQHWREAVGRQMHNAAMDCQGPANRILGLAAVGLVVAREDVLPLGEGQVP